MSAIPAQFRTVPGYIGNIEVRSFRGYPVGGASFGLGCARRDIPDEEFGFIAKHWCDDCKCAIAEPECVCVARETWGYYGGSPAEYENVCPSSGSSECGEHENPELGMKVVSRYRITTHKRAA